MQLCGYISTDLDKSSSQTSSLSHYTEIELQEMKFIREDKMQFQSNEFSFIIFVLVSSLLNLSSEE